jgi:hypothetical protein
MSESRRKGFGSPLIRWLIRLLAKPRRGEAASSGLARFYFRVGLIAVMLAIVCGWATVRWNINSGGSVAFVILLSAWLAFAASRDEANAK